MHLAGAGRVNLVNYSTCLHRLTRVVASPAHPCNQDDNACTGGRPERSGGGPGAVGRAICTVGVTAAEMACGVDLGTSILEGREGSNVLANWAKDIGGRVGGGGGNKAVEAEDVLGAITGGGGGGSPVASTLGGRQWQ
jgi:hypothetical protein